MWTLITLLWRIVTRMLRRLGMGALLVPVAAVGIAVLGVTVWTVAALALATVLAVRRPRVAAGLLPAVLICAGLCGLALAATAPGAVSVTAMSSWSLRWAALGPIHGQFQPGIGKRLTYQAWTPARSSPGAVEAGPQGKAAGPDGKVTGLAQARRTVMFGPGKPPPGPWTMFGPGPGRAFIGGPPPPARFPRNWMLVPLALLMLTVGLWLMPQSLARLRQRAGPLVPYLRLRAREIGWGLALVPAAAFGMSVFGVNPWTVAAVTAAVVITVWWPKAAADLVPFVLVVLALRGLQIAAGWQSLAAGVNGPGVPYGFVTVAGPRDALAAGAEASVFLALGAWLVPRTIGAHLRTTFTGAPDADLAGRVARLTETRGHAVDAAAAELRRIERDLHDGAQARLVALGMNLRAVERVLPGSPKAALALVAEARETSLRALNELRDLIRGICPPVLADDGVRGAERRLGTFDGILAVSSPPGGPTMIVMEVPCALLSPKTCSS